MRLLFPGCVMLTLLAGCETHQPVATTPAPPVAVVPPAPVAAPRSAIRLLGDTVDVSSLEYGDAVNSAVLDTLLRLGTRHYRLRLQAQADSSQELKAPPPDQVAVESVAVGSTADDRLILGPKHHYNVRYTITLLDSAGRRQFQRTFTKPDFYQIGGRELVRESEPIRPALIGYNGPRQWLLLRQEFGVDGTDWGGEVFLALDLKGHTQRLSPSNAYGGGGSDCRIQQSPDGQAIITCEELLLPGGRHQPLAKPHTELVAARFLSDTTLLAVYEYVTTRRVQYDGVWEMKIRRTPVVSTSPMPLFCRLARAGCWPASALMAKLSRLPPAVALRVADQHLLPTRRSTAAIARYPEGQAPTHLPSQLSAPARFSSTPPPQGDKSRIG